MLNYLVASKSGIRCKQSWQLPKSRQTWVEKWTPDKGVGVETTHQVVFHFSPLPRSAVPYICILKVMGSRTKLSWILGAFMYAKSWTRLWPPVPAIRELIYLQYHELSEAVMSIRALLSPLFSWILTSPKRRAKCAILLHPWSKLCSTLPRVLRVAEHAGPALFYWYNRAARAKLNLWLHTRKKQKPLDLQQWTSALLLWGNRLQT